MIKSDTIELRWVFSVIRRRWWFILLLALLGAISAFWVITRMPTVYVASTTLLVQPAPVSGTTVDYTSIVNSEQLARTYTRMLGGVPVMEAVIARLDLDSTPNALLNTVGVEFIFLTPRYVSRKCRARQQVNRILQ